MTDSTSSRSSGIGFLGLLGIVFIVLRLTDYIDWSWWWVLAPIWGPFAFILSVLVVICMALALIVALIAIFQK